MKIQNLIVVAALMAIASPALAVVKVYDADAQNGIPGDQIQYTSTQCPPIQPSPGTLEGRTILTDNGTGTVTMTSANQEAVTKIDFPDLTVAFGPGAFVFIDATAFVNVQTVPLGSGSTDPGGTVTWGVISGFTVTGVGFCIASPQTICTASAQLPHGSTSPVEGAASPTYDLGTWTFDVNGDMEATPYITRTTNGGTSNRQYLSRGAYVGTSVPALPLAGAGVLALALAIAGTRTLLRKK